MTQRLGDWIQTYSGIVFYPLDPLPEEIDIVDIAHSLSMQCRFGGHCLKFYSVAEHSCHIFDKAKDDNKLWGLLHDATEAYLADIPRPIKPHLNNYKEIETKLMSKIAKKYELSNEMPDEIKFLDTSILFSEAEQNMSTPTIEWKDKTVPLDIKLNFWSPEEAKKEFMKRFEEIKWKKFLKK